MSGVWTARGALRYLGTHLSTHDAAIASAVETIRAGGMVAVKGIGGFHLIVDARCVKSVRRLRGLKHLERNIVAVIGIFSIFSSV